MVKEAFVKGFIRGIKNIFNKFRGNAPPKPPTQQTFPLGQPPPPPGTPPKKGLMKSIKHFLVGTGQKPFEIESLYTPVEYSLLELEKVLKNTKKVPYVIYDAPGTKFHRLRITPAEVEYFKKIHPQETWGTAKFKFLLPEYKDVMKISPQDIRRYKKISPYAVKHLKDIDEKLFEIGGKQYYNPQLVLGKDIVIPLEEDLMKAITKGGTFNPAAYINKYLKDLNKVRNKLLQQLNKENLLPAQAKEIRKGIKKLEKHIEKVRKSKEYQLTSAPLQEPGLIKQILIGNNPNKTTADLIREGGIINLIRHGYKFSPEEKLLIDKLLRGQFSSLSTKDINPALNIVFGKGLPIYGLYQIGKGVDWSNPQVGDIARMAYHTATPGFFHYGLIPFTVGDIALSSAIEKLPNTYLTNWQGARQAIPAATEYVQAMPPAEFVNTLPYGQVVYS